MPEQTAVERTFAEAKAEQAALPRHDPDRTQKVVLCCLLALAVMYTLYFAQDILLPVFLAFLLALLLRPLVKRLRRIRVPEPLGAALVVFALVAALGWGLLSVARPAAEWVDRAPRVMKELQVKLKDIQAGIAHARKATEQIQDMGNDARGPREVVVRGPTLADTILTQTQVVLAQAGLTVALAFFFLAFGRHTLESVLRSMPRVRDRLHLADIVNTVQINISAYLVTITIINILLGLVAAGVFWALGVPNPVLFGMLGGIANFIPFIGPFIMAAIMLVVAALTFDIWWQVLAPSAAFLLLHAVEGNFLTPAIIGRRLTLNPIFVFATVLFWGWLWGVPGALLAVPILAVFKILCDATPQLRTIGALIGG